MVCPQGWDVLTHDAFSPLPRMQIKPTMGDHVRWTFDGAGRPLHAVHYPACFRRHFDIHTSPLEIWQLPSLPEVSSSIPLLLCVLFTGKVTQIAYFPVFDTLLLQSWSTHPLQCCSPAFSKSLRFLRNWIQCFGINIDLICLITLLEAL